MKIVCSDHVNDVPGRHIVVSERWMERRSRCSAQGVPLQRSSRKENRLCSGGTSLCAHHFPDTQETAARTNHGSIGRLSEGQRWMHFLSRPRGGIASMRWSRGGRRPSCLVSSLHVGRQICGYIFIIAPNQRHCQLHCMQTGGKWLTVCANTSCAQKTDFESGSGVRADKGRPGESSCDEGR